MKYHVLNKLCIWKKNISEPPLMDGGDLTPSAHWVGMAAQTPEYVSDRAFLWVCVSIIEEALVCWLLIAGGGKPNHSRIITTIIDLLPACLSDWWSAGVCVLCLCACLLLHLSISFFLSQTRRRPQRHKWIDAGLSTLDKTYIVSP